MHRPLRFAAIALAALPQAAWLLHGGPVALKLLHLAVLVTAITRPAAGLLVLSGLGPLIPIVATWGDSPVPPGRLLEVLVVACITGVLVRMRRDDPATVTGPWAALVAAVAAASLAAIIPARVLFHLPETSWMTLVREQLRGDYFVYSTVLEPLFFAALVIEGAALAWCAERITRRHPSVARGAVGLLVAAHAVVGLLTVERLAEAIQRSDQTLLHYLTAVRISIFYDKNAAGPVLAMVLLAGVGLAATRRTRVVLSAALGLVGLTLVLTGARLALAACVLSAFAGTILLGLRFSRRTLLSGAGAFTLVIAAVAALWSLYPSSRSLGGVVSGRLIMAGVALDMTRDAPAFGVGVGTFYERSSDYGGERLRWILGSDVPRENAHNNFLQILAEQGVIGLAACLGLLIAVIVPAVRSARGAGRFHRWLLLGVTAFVLTWFGSHPLLVAEAAFPFWLSFGLLAAQVPARQPSSQTRMLMAGVIVVVLLSALPRASAARRSAYLEHIGVGLSLWQPGEDGERYREAGNRFSLYLPSDAGITLPVRRLQGTPDPMRLEVRAGARLVNVLTVGGTGWVRVRVLSPASSEAFTRFDFSLTGPDGEAILSSPAVHVGKAIVQ